jgi:hypothetical protein
LAPSHRKRAWVERKESRAISISVENMEAEKTMSKEKSRITKTEIMRLNPLSLFMDL